MTKNSIYLVIAVAVVILLSAFQLSNKSIVLIANLQQQNRVIVRNDLQKGTLERDVALLRQEKLELERTIADLKNEIFDEEGSSSLNQASSSGEGNTNTSTSSISSLPSNSKRPLAINVTRPKLRVTSTNNNRGSQVRVVSGGAPNPKPSESSRIALPFGPISKNNITFALTRRVGGGGGYNSNINFRYACPNRKATPKEQLDRHFNFQTHLNTSLNIVMVGDSLAVEFGKGLQVAGGATQETILEHVHWGKTNDEYETLSAARVRGGGVVAYWRTLGYLRRKNSGGKLPNTGKGWRRAYATQLLNFTKHAMVPHPNKFDVLIFRTSHPWLNARQVRPEFMEETVKHAESLLGVQTVIFLTTPLNNNIMTVQQLDEFRHMNNRIRDYVKTSTTHDIRLCDMERYADDVIQYNARSLEGNFTEPLFLHKLKPEVRRLKHAQSIPQVCAKRVPDGSKKCEQNSYFNDGLHLCLESLGPRIYAALACLIQCTKHDRVCEAACNQQFMTLNNGMPV